MKDPRVQREEVCSKVVSLPIDERTGESITLKVVRVGFNDWALVNKGTVVARIRKLGLFKRLFNIRSVKEAAQVQVVFLADAVEAFINLDNDVGGLL